MVSQQEVYARVSWISTGYVTWRTCFIKIKAGLHCVEMRFDQIHYLLVFPWLDACHMNYFGILCQSHFFLVHPRFFFWGCALPTRNWLFSSVMCYSHWKESNVWTEVNSTAYLSTNITFPFKTVEIVCYFHSWMTCLWWKLTWYVRSSHKHLITCITWGVMLQRIQATHENNSCSFWHLNGDCTTVHIANKFHRH